MYFSNFGTLVRFSGPGSAKIELLGSKTSPYMHTRPTLVAGELKTPRFKFSEIFWKFLTIFENPENPWKFMTNYKSRIRPWDLARTIERPRKHISPIIKFWGLIGVDFELIYCFIRTSKHWTTGLRSSWPGPCPTLVENPRSSVVIGPS